MSNGRRWPWAAALVLLASIVSGAGDDAPLTTADVVRFLKAALSERTILAELQARGFAEELDAGREASLREAGASETLVVAVRRVAPGDVRYRLPSPGHGASAAPGPTASPSPRAPAANAPRPAPSPPAAPPAHGGLTFGATARSVRVPVSVLDRRGEPVLGLRGADFHISENGRRQPLTYFSGERRPLRIALALDVSGSMGDKMREVAEALRRFIDLLEPSDEIMVITFSGDVYVEEDFTSDRDKLERVFARLRPGRETALFDAAIEAVGRVAPQPAEGKAVVLVTDGMDTASRSSFGQLLEVARRSEVPVFSIGLGGGDRGLLGRGMSPPRGGRWPRGPGRWPPGGWPGTGGNSGTAPGRDLDARPLLDLAEETGGRAEILLAGLEDIRSGRLKQAAESIAITLRHRYLVGYEPEPGKSGWRKIKVEVERPSVKVQARKGYYAEG